MPFVGEAIMCHYLYTNGTQGLAARDAGPHEEVWSGVYHGIPLLFSTSGEPDRIGPRRVALLVYGKPGARLSGKDDVVEVHAPGTDTEGRALGLSDGMALVVRHFASQGQLVCDAIVGGRSRVVLAAIRGGCTFIRADEDQSRFDRVLEQPAGAVTSRPTVGLTLPAAAQAFAP